MKLAVIKLNRPLILFAPFDSLSLAIELDLARDSWHRDGEADREDEQQKHRGDQCVAVLGRVPMMCGEAVIHRRLVGADLKSAGRIPREVRPAVETPIVSCVTESNQWLRLMSSI